MTLIKNIGEQRIFVEITLKRKGICEQQRQQYVEVRSRFFHPPRSVYPLRSGAKKGTRSDFRECCERWSKKKVSVPYSRSLPIFFCLMRLVKRDALNTKTPASASVPLLLDFHISLQSPLQLLNTRAHTRAHPRERSDTRGEFIGTGRRGEGGPGGMGVEFTSAAGPLDGSSTRKLFSANYHWGAVPTTCSPPARVFQIFLD